MNNDPRGWHVGNENPVRDLDWQIMERVRPQMVVYLPGQRVTKSDILRVMRLNPDCLVVSRPYFDPRRLGDPWAFDYARVMPQYIDECSRYADELCEALLAGGYNPSGRAFLQPWNEQNMPRWALNDGRGEGFGDQLADMQRFNEWFVRAYGAIKARNRDISVGWTPLTVGNRDCWFQGDAVGHYYLHGPSGCVDRPDPSQIAAGVREGPCYDSLMLADVFFAHVYLHEAQAAWSAEWTGRRFERYARWLPKAMDMHITEFGVPGVTHWQTWTGDALLDWYTYASEKWPRLKTALWMLGDHWGGIWYLNGKPRPEVDRLAAWQPSAATAPVTPGVIKEPPMQIDGRCLSPREFEAHVAAMDFSSYKPNRIFLHHTWRPRVEDWNGAPTIAAMKAYYEGLRWTDALGRVHEGWSAGPHLFVAPDGIWLFTPLNELGYHAGGANNTLSVGLEMVGDYDAVKPSGAVLENTRAALSILCSRLGISPDALLFHRDVSSKTCPGTAVTKEWIIPLIKSWQMPPEQLPLPEDEEGPPELMADKIRWWVEELDRVTETGDHDRAREIRKSLIVLAYRHEFALKAKA